MTWGPKQSRILCLMGASVLALPLSWGMATGLFLWTSPLLLLNTVLARRPLSLFSVLGFGVLVLISLRHRWYCRWVCPTGTLCDAVSRKRPRTAARWIPSIGIVGAWVVLSASLLGVSLLGLLDPLSIFHAFFDGLRCQSLGIGLAKASGLLLVVGVSLVVPGVWCRKLCPLGGLQDMVTGLKGLARQGRASVTLFQPARRAALGVLVGTGVGLLFKRTGSGNSRRLRPPGALPPDEFLCTCIRCGNCSKVCPTGIVQASLDASELSDLLTPCLSFSSGYCLPECTACGRVCPSGAIQPFAREDKGEHVIGLAHIKTEDCLLGEQKECDRCRFYCAYGAISIRASDIDFNAWPDVHEDRCVGCGACVAACPACAITVEPIPVSLAHPGLSRGP